MRLSLDRVRIVTASAVLTLSLAFGPSLAVAAERPSNPAQLLLWLLSLERENAERRKIDVNSATVEALTAVPGLERHQALKIVAERPYARLEDLTRAGLSPRSIERLAGWLTARAPAAQSPDKGAALPPAKGAGTPGR